MEKFLIRKMSDRSNTNIPVTLVQNWTKLVGGSADRLAFGIGEWVGALITRMSRVETTLTNQTLNRSSLRFHVFEQPRDRQLKTRDDLPTIQRVVARQHDGVSSRREYSHLFFARIENPHEPRSVC